MTAPAPLTEIERATQSDAEEILALQLLCYRSEAAFYDDWTIPPLTQTLEQMRADVREKVVLKARLSGRIIGSVRAGQEGETCLVGRLIVDPDFQRQGIGSRLLLEIETYFPEAKYFELFTGERSENTIRLYTRLGYRLTRREAQTSKVNIVFLEKSLGA